MRYTKCSQYIFLICRKFDKNQTHFRTFEHKVIYTDFIQLSQSAQFTTYTVARSLLCAGVLCYYCVCALVYTSTSYKCVRISAWSMDQRYGGYWKCLAVEDLQQFMEIDGEIQGVNLQNGSVYRL